jgi:hypothetical protein
VTAKGYLAMRAATRERMISITARGLDLVAIGIATWFYWRTKDEYVTLLRVVLRTCTVAVKDIRDVEHSIEVTAETLYEAIATALAAFQQDNWVGEIGEGFTTVTVLVQQPPVKHEVRMKDFLSWLRRQGRSPAEVTLKQKLEKILGKVNRART